MRRYEARGVTCLACANLDLKTHQEASKRGFGWCAVKPVPQFVSFAMSRNCLEFDRAPDEVVGPREKWADKIRMFWQK